MILGLCMIALMSPDVFARSTDLIDLAANVEPGEFVLVWSLLATAVATIWIIARRYPLQAIFLA